MLAHEAHDAAELGTAFHRGDGAGLDDQGVDLRETAGHAFQNHQLCALYVDLAQGRPLECREQLVEAAQRHMIEAQEIALAHFFEQSRALDVGTNFELGLAVMVA